MKIATIFGARPQFIKAAAVSHVFRTFPHVEEVMIHTGQHYDENLSKVFFSQLGIPEPTFNLGIGSATHGAQTGRMLEAIESLLVEVRPDYVLVYGDTNSTLAGALAAVKLHIPVAHVEAGLRSYNRQMPEEVNRILTDHSADLLFAPTRTAVENLAIEGIGDGRVHFVGDVMYDVALRYSSIAEQNSSILDRLGLQDRSYVLATIHRASNADHSTQLRIILDALMQLSRRLPIVLPLHPRTRASLGKAGMLKDISENIRILDPTGYLDTLMLEKHARLIVTDSGGMQKEAFFHRVPCVTLRAETEWTELLELGWNRLAPPRSSETILSVLSDALEARPGKEACPYGNGKCAERIVNIITAQLEQTGPPSQAHDSGAVQHATFSPASLHLTT